MDTRFSSAIHTLILVAEAEMPLSSEQIASSVGTNASYIRKITSLLKKKGLIDSHRGISGFTLKLKPEELTLLQIYQAVNDMEVVCLFDLHQNANDQCVVGHHIKPVLADMFAEMEAAFAHELAGKTLADCIAAIRKELEMEK